MQNIIQNICVLVYLSYCFNVPSSDAAHSLEEKKLPPHIVFILADDLGYADIQSFDPIRGAIPTPHIDSIGENGAMFMDAHTTSAVCSPSRYSIITGQYNWRSRLQSGALHGLSPPLIQRNQPTIGTLLKSGGYKTGFVGKWHIGLKFNINMQDHLNPDKSYRLLNFSHHIEEGPVNVGFDEYFGLTASLDIPPYVYIRDRNFVTPDSQVQHTVDQKNVFWGRAGPVANGFIAEDTMDLLLKESKSFLSKHTHSNTNPIEQTPLFLYISLTSPHTPVLPSQTFKGKSRVGWYGDFVMQTDDFVGQIKQHLQDLQIINNTLLIFTSDNGFANAGMNNGHNGPDAMKHHPSGIYRGQKSDIYEGGHRVPLVMQWPRVIPPRTRVLDVVSLVDMYATFADAAGVSKETEGGPDSHSLLPLLTPSSTELYKREYTILHSIQGKFGVRQGQWMLALCHGSGGWTPSSAPAPKPKEFSQIQLWDLEKDPSQAHDLLVGASVSEERRAIVRNLTHMYHVITGRRSRVRKRRV